MKHSDHPTPKGINLRETERMLRAAKRANRRAFAALCATQREARATASLSPEQTAERSRLRRLADVKGGKA